MTIRAVIGPAFIRSLLCTDAVTRSSRASIASVWSRRPVVEDVDLDALEQPERPAERAVDGVDDADLLGEPLGGQAVGDPQLGAVVGEHEPLVAELDAGQHHLVDRASRRRSSRSGGGSHRAARHTASSPASTSGAAGLLLQRRQVCRELAPQRLGDDAAGRLPDAGELLQRPGLGALAQLRGVERLERLDGVAERLDPVGAGAGALEEEADAPQRLDRVDRGLERFEERDHQSPNCRATTRSHSRSPPTVRVATMALAAGVRR